MKNRKYFLFTYLLISVNFFGLLPFSNWLNINQRYILLMIMILICLFSKSSKGIITQRIVAHGYKIACLLFLGIFGSMVSCYIFWEQGLSISILTYRFTYSFLLFPILLKIKPTISEIEWTIKWGAILSLVIWIISIYSPALVGIETNQNILENADIGVLNRGFHFFIFYIYIMLSRLTKKFSIFQFITILFFIICLILMQNRSMLIGVLIIFSFIVFKSKAIKSKYKLLILASTLVILIVNNDINNIFSSLWNETTEQLKDEDYNRNKALTYFLYYHSPNPLCYLFGNGIPSLGISEFGKHMEIISSNGIVTSDLGLIGCWVEFGLIPIIIILYFIFTIFNIKNINLSYLKFIYFHMLLIPTIWGFWNVEDIYLFSIIFYLSIITISLNKRTDYATKSK